MTAGLKIPDAVGPLHITADLWAGKVTCYKNPSTMISDPARELKSFRVALSANTGTKRGTGRGLFIDSVLDAVDVFYEQVLQNLKPWIAAPPRLRPADEPVAAEPVAKSLISTSISSQDGPLPAEQGG